MLDDGGILFRLPVGVKDFFFVLFNASMPALGYTQWVPGGLFAGCDAAGESS